MLLKIKRILGVTLSFCCLFAWAAPAATVQPATPPAPVTVEGSPVTLQMDSIVAQVVGEKGGDELFVDILALSSMLPAQHLRVPKSPNYWPSKALKQIQKVTLWQGNVGDGETKTLIISLMEKDTMPWNIHDVVGTLIFTIHAVQGEVSVLATNPTWPYGKKPLSLQPNKQQSFEVSGIHGAYHMVLGYVQR